MRRGAVIAMVLAMGCGPDAPTPDASIIVDARGDAATDGAAIDAPTDAAMIDGTMIDAATDAATIDAAGIDAAAIDAAGIDAAAVDAAAVDGATDAVAIDAAGCPVRTFTMDGVLDSATTVVGGITGVRLASALAAGGVLYLATDDAGEGSDHFLLVSATAPGGGTLAAPFAKAGVIAVGAGPMLFVADENDNGFAGWFRRESVGGDTQLTGPTYQVATGANGGVLEATIDLVAAFGAIPATIYVAAVPYATADGGALVSSAQTPAGNGDGTVDAAEYAAITLACP